MRNFSYDEKVLLEYIFERHSSWDEERNLVSRMSDLGVGTLFEKIAIDSGVKIEFNSTDKKIIVTGFSEKTYGREYEEKLFKIQYKIALILSLLNYLEKNHLIYLFSFPNELVYIQSIFNEAIVLVERPDGRLPNSSYLPFSREYDFIFENYKKSIILTPELLELVVNGFKDKEQLRHEENILLQRDSLEQAKISTEQAKVSTEQAKESTKAATKLGWISIGIAVISTVISSIFSILPENRKQQFYNYLFSTTEIVNLKEQQLNYKKTDAVSGKQVKVIEKNVNAEILKSKLAPINKTKKQIKTDSLKKILPTDTLKNRFY